MSAEKNTQVIMIGNGGHARVLLATLALLDIVVAGTAVSNHSNQDIASLSDDALLRRSPADYMLVNGVGGAAVPHARTEVYRRFQAAGFPFVSVVHPQAIIATDVDLGSGVQVMAGAIIQPASKIGANVLLNTRSVVEHDCIIADHVHVATGAVLAGGVSVGQMTLIGAGATVNRGIRIGSGALIAAGAVVVRDVPDGACVGGIPARPLRSRTQ